MRVPQTGVQDVRGKVALIEVIALALFLPDERVHSAQRGVCQFLDKTRFAMQQGAVAALIYTCARALLRRCLR